VRESTRFIAFRRQNVEAATVFNETRAEWLEGNVLRVLFPLTLPMYARLTSDPCRTKLLQDAVEEVYGKRPTEVRCEVPYLTVRIVSHRCLGE
jgi:hypothetical protein